MSEIKLTAADTPEWSAIPLRRKQWFAGVISLILMPAGLWLMWSGPTWRKTKGAVEQVRRWEKLLITVLALFVFGLQVAKLAGGGIVATELPACDAPTTIRSLKSSVETSPAGRTQGLRLIEVEAPSEAAWNETPPMRSCRASAVTNGGNRSITYELRWLEREKGRWLVQWRM